MTKVTLLLRAIVALVATTVTPTTVSPVAVTTTTASPVVTSVTPTTTASVVVTPTTTASTVPTSTVASTTTTRAPATTKVVSTTPTTTIPTTPQPTNETPSTSSSTGRAIFRGFANLDDWVWWIVIGGGALVLLLASVCCCICIRRGKAKAREEAIQAMEEQREADNHARLLADAQKQRRDREATQQNGRVTSLTTAHGNGSSSETSPAKRPTYYRRPSQGRGAYLQSSAVPPPIHTSHPTDSTDVYPAPYISVTSPTNAKGPSYHPPSSVNDRIEALKALSSVPVQKDSYSSEPGVGFLTSTPVSYPNGTAVYLPNPRDTTLTGYSMDIDGDYESTSGGTFLSAKDSSLYQELDSAKVKTPTRAAVKSTDSKQSDASDFELDVDDAATGNLVSSHRSIEVSQHRAMTYEVNQRSLPDARVPDHRNAHGAQVHHLNANRDMRGLERLCKSIVAHNHAALDGHVPSVYEYLGVAQYNLGRLQDATESFKKAVALHPNHGEVYMHLGDCYLSQFLVDDAIRVFEVALVEKKIKDDLSVLFKARNWVANWTDHELVQDTVAASTASNLIHVTNSDMNSTFLTCIMQGRTPLVSAADLGNLPGNVILQASQRALHSQPSTVTFCCSPDDPQLQASSPKLKIGTRVYCFALTDAPSWWRTNITAEVDHMISLHGVNHQEAASAIYSHGIHVLVDLNGHTLHSGLPIFSHRPAPVQMTFLGYPLTTGSSFIDYFIVDPVSASPLHVHDSFSEKMIYLPHNYIVNDHKQVYRVGWTVVNIQPLPHVDLVREMKHLHGIADSSVTAIYSSHALEHCGYGTHAADVEATLAEWFRVLKPGGALFVSVPDLSVLATLFVDPTLTPHERFHVMRMIYGGQVDAHDFHKVGFNKDILNSFLAQAGFCNVTTVRSFGLFQDTSDLVFHNKSISLNVIAKACKPGDDVLSVDLPSPTAT
ncbi:hypothetical protein B5M09_002308 [Aphanomyces astaci]|uniref:protein O-GlcNAc transferase n=1 Tax=Aphanomyces astaci TaxID=112090 RepID=A0A425DCG0_APHAT|nr:hypothetical protein B5M09_002308 [Aphanomyces astaci]